MASTDTYLAWDSKVIIYQGRCSSLNCVRNNNDVNGFFAESAVGWNSVAGAIYHIQVTAGDLYNWARIGPFILRVEGTHQLLTQTAGEYSIPPSIRFFSHLLAHSGCPISRVYRY
jgi:hypothetical protein